jgi:hypothetical protein
MTALLRRAKQLAFYATAAAAGLVLVCLCVALAYLAEANPQVAQHVFLIIGLGIMGFGVSQLVSKASHALGDLSRSVYAVEKKLEWQAEAIEALRREIRERDNATGG